MLCEMSWRAGWRDAGSVVQRTCPGQTDNSPRPVPFSPLPVPGLGKHIVYLALKKNWYKGSETKLIVLLKSFVTNEFF